MVAPGESDHPFVLNGISRYHLCIEVRDWT